MKNLRLPGLFILAAVLSVAGWCLINATFMWYDDEGYVLLAYKNFSEHGGLYDSVFTQYGPAPFLYYDLLHRVFRQPFVHSFERTITLGHWIAASLFCGVIAWRLTRRYWTALFTTVLAFGYLTQMTWEPGHPGGLIAFVIAAALTGAIEAIWRNRLQLAVIIMSVAGAALLLTKINVGLLWCCSGGAFLLLHAGAPRWRRWSGWLARGGLMLLPFLLMHALLHEAGVFTLAIMFAAAAGLISLLVEDDGGSPEWRWGDCWPGIIALAATGGVMIVAVLLHHTSLAGLIQGVLIAPLRLPANFHTEFSWRPASWIELGLSVILVSCWRWNRRDWLRWAGLVACVRVACFGVFVWYARTWLTSFSASRLSAVALPLIPLFLLPLTTQAGNRERQLRGLVALIGAGQVLHVYPVAGSQMGWGTFLLLPLYVSGLVEAIIHLAARLRMPRLTAVTAVFMLGVAGLQTYWLSTIGWRVWHESTSLNLPGGEAIHLPVENATALRVLTLNASIHADLLYSWPGMFSFNLWSGVPTPTLRNATHWFWLLNAAEQQEIVDRLRVTPRSAVIVSRLHLDFLTKSMHMVVGGRLVDEIKARYQPLFVVSGFEFLMPKGSLAVPFFVVETYHRSAGASEAAGTMLVVNVVARSSIQHVILRDMRGVETDLNEHNCEVQAQPIAISGRPGGPPVPMKWPLQFNGVYRLALYPRLATTPDFMAQTLAFFDAEGTRAIDACYDAALPSAPPRH